jgi:hypothetical protein
MTTMLRLDRRRFLVQSSSIVGTTFLVSRRRAWAAGPNEPVVDTTSGKIRGAAIDGINAFRGSLMVPQQPGRTGSRRQRNRLRGAPSARLSTGLAMRPKLLPASDGPRWRAYPAFRTKCRSAKTA